MIANLKRTTLRHSGGLSIVGTRNRESESIESTLKSRRKGTPSRTYLGKLRLVTTRGRTYDVPMWRDATLVFSEEIATRERDSELREEDHSF